MNKKNGQTFGVVAAMVISTGLSIGCANLGSKESDVVISMNDLPPTVKSLATKEMGGGKIKEVEKEMDHGKMIYAITYFDTAGKLMEIEYAEDGTLISKGKE